MKPFPRLILFTLAAAGYALPVSFEAAATLVFVAGLGAVICLDYPQRYRGLRVPRRAAVAAAPRPRRIFRAPPLRVEPHRLAA
jgi:hypothetical protein